ncbi:MAG: hypothetical protein FD123_905 [Bacteroidetes bacterium]|nr:MAG: hypothetical protein FD123_905 [Bacteroidota bacterium]
MIFRIILAGAVLCSTLQSAAQDSTATKKRELISLQATLDFMNFYNTQDHIYQVLPLAPGMVMLHEDKPGFTQLPDHNNQPAYKGGEIRAEIRMKEPDTNKRFASRLVLGLGYKSRKTYCLSYAKNDLVPFGSFLAANGDLIFLDSVVKEQYHFSWRTKSIALQAGQLFNFHGRKPSLAYAGYLLEFQVPFESRVDGQYTYTAIKIATLQQYPDPAFVTEGYAPTYVSTVSEKKNTPAVLICRASIPLGTQLKWRFRKTKTAFGFSYELRPGAEFVKVSKVVWDYHWFINFHFGFKYFFPQPAATAKTTG